MTVNNLSNYLDDIIVKVGGTKTNDDVVTGTLYNRISVNEANIESLNTDVSNVYGSLNNKQDNLRFVEKILQNRCRRAGGSEKVENRC